MATIWTLNPPHAQCQLPGRIATVDLRMPHAGLALAQGLNVLGVLGSGEEPQEPSDCYQRGADLVATYPHRPEFPVRVQIYWRIVAPDQLPPQASGIDLQVSVQTPLLDACPRVMAVSELSASEAFWLEDEKTARFASIDPGSIGNFKALQSALSCTLVRSDALGGGSYVEMVHPADDCIDGTEWSRTSPSPRLELSHTLFAESLEKGVILRARLRGVLLPRHGDEQAAVAAYRSFINAELPLTT